jgi:DNA-binding MarR family transcriptional regulator
MKRDALIAEARAMLLRRKRRELFFNPALLSEPAWDLLLVLYALGGNEPSHALDDFVETINAPRTVICRWISVLESEGLIQQRPGTGAGMGRVGLTATGRAKLDTYFACGV